jgi:hypothetical protein
MTIVQSRSGRFKKRENEKKGQREKEGGKFNTPPKLWPKNLEVLDVLPLAVVKMVAIPVGGSEIGEVAIGIRVGFVGELCVVFLNGEVRSFVSGGLLWVFDPAVVRTVAGLPTVRAEDSGLGGRCGGCHHGSLSLGR